jgi:hypothetical protein
MNIAEDEVRSFFEDLNDLPGVEPTPDPAIPRLIRPAPAERPTALVPPVIAPVEEPEPVVEDVAPEPAPVEVFAEPAAARPTTNVDIFSGGKTKRFRR